ncbi:MAG TPA: TMEM165/GDT1 family protein [Bacteroidales bacterium]|nr:TMEM165/GDT1 family protein [Bacteroidales bacterium]HXK91542.1 TMEM165/GDT1 family protein [Bacteroidales bacterium]
MFSDILIPFLLVSLAEFADKTQLLIIVLASKTNKHFNLFWGIILAFAIVDGIAILAGSLIANLIPQNVMKIVAGGIFIIFGIITFIKREEEIKLNKKEINPFITGFLLIFIGEWGDKTQIASATLATQYNPWLVFLGVILAMSLMSILSIFLGNVLMKKIKPKTMSIISGLLFIIIGIFTFISLWV